MFLAADRLLHLDAPDALDALAMLRAQRRQAQPKTHSSGRALAAAPPSNVLSLGLRDGLNGPRQNVGTRGPTRWRTRPGRPLDRKSAIVWLPACGKDGLPMYAEPANYAPAEPANYAPGMIGQVALMRRQDQAILKRSLDDDSGTNAGAAMAEFISLNFLSHGRQFSRTWPLRLRTEKWCFICTRDTEKQFRRSSCGQVVIPHAAVEAYRSIYIYIHTSGWQPRVG